MSLMSFIAGSLTGLAIFFLLIKLWAHGLLSDKSPPPPPRSPWRCQCGGDAETVAYDGRVNDALSTINRVEAERDALEVENRRLRERNGDLQAQIPVSGYRKVD